MPKYTYVYLRDQDSNGCVSACVEHIKKDEHTILKIAFSFSSPNEKHFSRKEARDRAIERMEAGKFIELEKFSGVSTYDTVKRYLMDSAAAIEEDNNAVRTLFKIEPYKIGKNVSLTSEFWGWLFWFSRRV